MARKNELDTNQTNFAVALSEWFEDVKKLANISTADQLLITTAGAEVYKEALEEVTNRKHRTHYNRKVYGHMADSILLAKKNPEGQKDGTCTVGFDQYHALNAWHLNDGTKFMVGDHFITNTQENTAKSVLLAEKAAYMALISERGGSL